ncbi:MAG: HupE/UreJ family protein [Gammaproteobacteria bacterium]|nr:HupE/UreJ family protein [Gammaproteobacteria bacterium]MBT8443598.1 HupE/UreJ family protein [Gammaproteobacteria bacterium]NND35977.1 HupE/UreJ family protein [Gammaproteobacteria bacterium]
MPPTVAPRRPAIALAWFCLILGLLVCSVAAAHRLRPAIVTITFYPDATYAANIDLNAEAILAGISPEHQDTNESPNAREYDALRELPPAELRERIDSFGDQLLTGVGIEIDGERMRANLTGIDVPEVGDVSRERITTLHLSGTLPDAANSFVWSYDERFGSSAIRVKRADEDTVQTAFLDAGETSETFEIGAPLQPKTTPEIYRDYIGLGYTHILPKGLDHILFVLGIFLLSVRWRPLLLQVTAFTVAHTITLGLSLYGIIALPASVVEPLIALSIVYVGVENMLTPRLKPWRVFVVFGFGLLHGMGFAGVLQEIGLPENEYLNALIAFNIGVELGQLSVIALAFLAVGAWFSKRDWYRARVVIPGSLLISLIGAYWFVERIIA